MAKTTHWLLSVYRTEHKTQQSVYSLKWFLQSTVLKKSSTRNQGCLLTDYQKLKRSEAVSHKYVQFFGGVKDFFQHLNMNYNMPRSAKEIVLTWGDKLSCPRKPIHHSCLSVLVSTHLGGIAVLLLISREDNVQLMISSYFARYNLFVLGFSFPLNLGNVCKCDLLALSSSVLSSHWTEAVWRGSAISATRCRAKLQQRSARIGFLL